MSSALTLLGGVLSLFTNPLSFFAGADHWLSSALMPPDLQTWFLGTMGASGDTWNPASIYEDVFHVVQEPALVIAAVAAAARVVRVTLDHRVAAGHVIADTMPRFLVAVALIGIPGTHVSLGYSVLVFAVNAAMALSSLLFALFLQASLLQGLQPGEGWFDHLTLVLATAGSGNLLVMLGLIPLLVLVLYAMFLMITRTVMLGFCVAMAPLCIATGAFDLSNRFVHWWLDLFVGVLLLPLVLTSSIALSITFASSVIRVQTIGPLLAIVVMCGGLWFASKTVHAIVWRHFSHGSALAGFAAGVTTMLAPLHRLGTIGHVAEAFGANRDGGNAAINAMKRLGMAAQGMPTASVAGALTTGDGGGALLARAGLADVRPAAGPPNIAAALGASGRTAVAGAEGRFSQEAFNAFARGRAQDIGRLTRDQPFGSLPPADRARLAWERTSARIQREFADDFLSHWLGTVGEADGSGGVTLRFAGAAS